MSFINYPPTSPFICPTIRTANTNGHSLKTKEIRETRYFIIDNSYQFSEDEDDKFSHSHHLFLLLGCNSKEDEQNDKFCMACYSSKIGTTYYFCNECDEPYHKECVESPSIFISPHHPKYPLQLLKFDVRRLLGDLRCHCCGLRIRGLCYHSSICDLIMDPVCARKQEFSPIMNPKRHDHILHYFPRKASLTCDVCALDNANYCFYVCLQCGFVVHVTCIYLPKLILISYHNHTLSFTSSLPSGDWFCGVCRRKIDENYGEYSCTKGCTYAVHSKCATQRGVWDEKELEDEPEMEYDNIQLFEEIGDGIIRHFTHANHHMRLTKDIERVYDEKQRCQACVLPLYDGNVYICMQCDFSLHEACANLPLIKQHAGHPHRFIIRLSDSERSNYCSSCKRNTCGFEYECHEGCFYSLDVRCASLPEQVDHQSHPHPLFLIYGRESNQTCSTCGRASYRCLNCVKCDFALCFICATLPQKVRHEYDEHFLTLSYEQSASSPYWCQVCEEKTDPKKGCYTCKECGGTFHIECILGNDPYMKAGRLVKNFGRMIEIIPNNSLSRPICKECQRRCQNKIVYKTHRGNIVCSYSEIRPSS